VTRTAAVKALVALLVVQGIGAIGGGLVLVIGPDGHIMKMPVSNLHGMFSDYLIPGLILLIVLGIGPIVTAIGLWSGHTWAWYASFAVGCALMIWIVVEVTVIPFSVLQVIFGIIGVAIAVVSLLPSVRRFCGVRVLDRRDG
jgi:hypothetical protein